jgi:hypothetical protein
MLKVCSHSAHSMNDGAGLMLHRAILHLSQFRFQGFQGN